MTAIRLKATGSLARAYAHETGIPVSYTHLDVYKRQGTRYIVRGGDRLGVYYVEQGAGYRGQTIVYDRAGSAIAEAAANEFDWKHIFTDSGAEWFHFSGITPALSDTCAALCLSACRAAKRPVSYTHLRIGWSATIYRKLSTNLKNDLRKRQNFTALVFTIGRSQTKHSLITM